MKTNHLVAFAAGCLLLATIASAQEKKIKRSDLPPAVEKTVAAQSEGATSRGFSTEKENRQTFYEAEMMVNGQWSMVNGQWSMVNGHSKDVLVAADATVAEVEEQVVLDSLLADVKAGLQAKAGKRRILKVESIIKKASSSLMRPRSKPMERTPKSKSDRTGNPSTMKSRILD